jgi:methionyl-tRNA formyltransferase
MQIPFYFVDNHNSDSSISLIQNLKINCLLNVGTPRRLSANFLSSIQYGVINIHPGLLPAYRGCSAVEWAIYNNDKVGNTAHFMDEGYDTGPIIESEWYEFEKNSSYQSIRIKVYLAGCSLAARLLSRMQDAKLTLEDANKQDEAMAKYWEPISDVDMNKVFEKISAKKYEFQRL